jgi:ankyrin repeat protein
MDDRGRIPLHLSLERNQGSRDVLDLVELLLKFGADVNAQDKNNVTPLHLASCKGWLSIARMLLDHGANANAKDDQGQTPLQSLVRHSRDFRSGLDLAQPLLKHGADVNAQDNDNAAPLH